MQQITLTSRTCTQLESNSSLSFLSVCFRVSLTIANTRNFRLLPSPGLHSLRLFQPEGKFQPNAVLAGNTPLLPAGVPWLCPH